MFKLEFSNNSKKFLKKAEKKVCIRILNKIEELINNPFPSDCKRVEGRSEKVYRIRVGNYRILYVVFQNENKLSISDIDKRSKIY